MKRDEIVEEVRRERDRIAAQYDYDLGRLFEAMKKEQDESGREVVSLPGRKAIQVAKTP